MYKTYHNLSVETICNCFNEVFNTSLNQSKIFECLTIKKNNQRIYFDCKTKKLGNIPKENTIKILEISHPFVNVEVDKIKFESVFNAGLNVLKAIPKERYKAICEYLCWYDTVINTTQKKEDVEWFKLFLINLRDNKNEDN